MGVVNGRFASTLRQGWKNRSKRGRKISGVSSPLSHQVDLVPSVRSMTELTERQVTSVYYSVLRAYESPLKDLNTKLLPQNQTT